MHESKISGTFRWIVEQGFEMGRPSMLEVEIDKIDADIREIRVGGAAVMVSKGVIDISGSAPA
jgi:trans-2,3-dihydro-3-hydroxyanthranilate isomerase